MGNPLEAMEALDGQHDVNGVVLTVDLYQKTPIHLARDCSPGFEARLVAQRNGADLCYAVHADGFVLLTPSTKPRVRLDPDLQRGAACIATEDYVIIKKKLYRRTRRRI